jgi:hypothetical protein
MIWLGGSSPSLPSNFRIFEGSLVGMGSQAGSCKIGSMVNFVKYKGFKLDIYGKNKETDVVVVPMVGVVVEVTVHPSSGLFDENLNLTRMSSL